MEKIKVLVVDDSPIVRSALVEIFSSDPLLHVMGTASDPYIAANIIKNEVPDVISLDIEMPRMDGLTFLQKIMSQHPIPVVVISSLTKSGTKQAMQALEYGAVDVMQKPQFSNKTAIKESQIKLCDIIKAAAMSKLKRKRENTGNHTLKVTPKLSADAVISGTNRYMSPHTSETIIAVGASTGGTEALRIFLEAMPANAHGIIVVQHMPEHFTQSFAERLNDLCRMKVKEAEDGDAVYRGRVLIAPGNKHMLLRRSGTKFHVEIKDGPLVNRHRPSVDVLFRSTAIYAGSKAIGVIMTGMGDDGARGMKEMKEAGALTIAQNKESCVVFGMPKEAIKLGGVDHILPLDKIASHILTS